LCNYLIQASSFQCALAGGDGTRFRAQGVGTGGIGEELDDEPHWVVTDARNDLADDAGVAGDADALANLGRLIVVEVSGGDDLVAAT
jgi:hypothetical protein